MKPLSELSTPELVREYKAQVHLEELIRARMASLTSAEEKAKVDALIARAFQPNCEFDRKHLTSLLTLALQPNEVSWQFRVRESLHRLFHRRH
jgi:hypothetical protein